MKRISLVVALVVGSLFWVGSSASAEDSTTTSTEASTSSSEATTTIASTTTVEPSSNPCFDPGYACGWAVVEPDGSVSNIIVCTFEVCGTGYFAGMRTVLQTRQMEGGNVAGWGNAVYVEETNTFLISGGGSIRGGDFIENAIFPSTTMVPTPPLDQEGQPVGDFLASQTDVVVVPDAVSFQVPIIEDTQVDYVVEFDPEGSSPSSVVQVGSVGGDVTSQSAAARSHSRIFVSLRSIGSRAGTLTLNLSVAKKPLASISARVATVRTYGSCAQLRAAYPQGVRASRVAVDKAKGKVVTTRAMRPLVHPALYRLNSALDRDRDRVLCERG